MHAVDIVATILLSVGNRIDPDGNLQVRLPVAGSEVVSVEHRQVDVQ